MGQELPTVRVAVTVQGQTSAAEVHHVVYEVPTFQRQTSAAEVFRVVYEVPGTQLRRPEGPSRRVGGWKSNSPRHRNRSRTKE